LEMPLINTAGIAAAKNQGLSIKSISAANEPGAFYQNCG
jgi:hypothetical protein